MTIDEYLSRNKNTSSSFAASNAASKLVNSATNANAAKQEQLAARQAQSRPTQTSYAGMTNSQAAQAAREAELARQRAAEQQSSAYQAAQAKAQQAIQTARAQAQKQSEAMLASARARLAEQQAARVRAQAAQSYSIPSIGTALDAYKYDNQAAAARKQLEQQRKAQADQAKSLSVNKQKAEQLLLRKASRGKNDDDNYDPLANGPYIVDPINLGYGMDTDPHTGLPLIPGTSGTVTPGAKSKQTDASGLSILPGRTGQIGISPGALVPLATQALFGNTGTPTKGETIIKPSEVDAAKSGFLSMMPGTSGQAGVSPGALMPAVKQLFSEGSTAAKALGATALTPLLTALAPETLVPIVGTVAAKNLFGDSKTKTPTKGETIIKPTKDMLPTDPGSKNVPTRTLTKAQEDMARNIYNNILNNGGSADQAAKAVENTFGIKGYTVSDNAYHYDPSMHMPDYQGAQPKDTDLDGYGRGRGGDFDLSSLLGDWIYYMPDVDGWLADSRADYGIGDYGWALGQLEDYFGKALGDLRSYGDRVLNSASDNNANARKNLLNMLRNNRASALTSGANLGAELSNNLQSVQTQTESANSANTELQQSIYKLIAEFMQNRAGLPSQATNMLAPYYEADSNVRANYLYGNAASINDAAAALAAAKLYA